LIKLLSISGSPVTESSTEFILRRLAEKIEAALTDSVKVESNFVKLNSLTFLPCQACGEAPAAGFCIYDDLCEVYDQLVACDCLLFGSPVYFDSVAAQAKQFIDRCNCIRPPDYQDTDPEHRFIKLLDRKRPGAIVLVGGQNGWYEGARRVVAGFFKWVEVVNEGLITYGSPDFRKKGTAADHLPTLEAIDKLAIHLASQLAKLHQAQA